MAKILSSLLVISNISGENLDFFIPFCSQVFNNEI